MDASSCARASSQPDPAESPAAWRLPRLGRSIRLVFVRSDAARAHRREQLAGDVRAACGRASRARRGAIAASRARSASRLADLARPSRGPVSSASGITTAAPGALDVAGVGRLVVGGRVRIRDQHRRPAGRGDLEDRPAGAGDDQVAGDQRVAEVVRCTRAGRSAGPGERRSGRSRSPAACSTRKLAPANASSAAWLIERAPSEPPKTSTQVSSGSNLEAARAAARSLAAGGTGRPVTRKRGGSRPSSGKARQTRRATGASSRLVEPEVAVGLGQHAAGPDASRPRARPARRRSRPRPATASGAAVRTSAPGVPDGGGIDRDRPGGLQRSLRGSGDDAQRVQLVAGRRHELASARSPPTNTTSAPSARSASATASAGTTCPAVPPAAITISGALTATARGRGPALVDRSQRLAPRSRDVEQQPDDGQHHAEVRRRVRDERQRHAGQRRDPEHDEDVEDPLAQDQRGQPGRQQLGIAAGRAPGARSAARRRRSSRRGARRRRSRARRAPRRSPRG